MNNYFYSSNILDDNIQGTLCKNQLYTSVFNNLYPFACLLKLDIKSLITLKFYYFLFH